jgi:hypothetical protein
MAVHEMEAATKAHRLSIWVVVLAISTVGLAGWIVYDLFFSATAAPSFEIMGVVMDYVDAWNEADPVAFEAVVTDDYVFQNEYGTYDLAGQLENLTKVDETNMEASMVGWPIWAGDGPWYVSVADRMMADDWDEPVSGIGTVTIVQEGDTYLVDSHICFSDLP